MSRSPTKARKPKGSKSPEAHRARLVEHILDCSRSWRSDQKYRIPVRETGFDEALRESLPKLSSSLGTDLEGFLAAAHTEAAFELRIVEDEGGNEYVAHIELFLVPFHGDVTEIDAITEEDLDFLSFGIERSRMFPPGALIGILSRLVTTSVVASLSAETLAQITRDLGDAILLEDQFGDTTPEITALFDGIATRLTSTETKRGSRATRCIFGARVVLLEPGEGIPADCLFPAGEEMAEISDAIDEWIEHAYSHVSNEIYIGDPAIWTSSVPTLLAIEASADLDDQMRSRGIANSKLPGVTLALDHDVSEAVVHLTASIGGRIVGHTKVARAGAMLDYGAFLDTLGERYDNIQKDDGRIAARASSPIPSTMLN